MGVLALPFLLLLSPADLPSPIVTPERASSTDTYVMEDVAVTADEPRFVAPTRRDKIGRIWAPVTVNGQGPFPWTDPGAETDF